MSVRAKFKVWSKEANGDGFEVQLHPVVGGSAENDRFYKYTPSGHVVLGTINPEAAEQFEVGDQFYVDFTKAPAAGEG